MLAGRQAALDQTLERDRVQLLEPVGLLARELEIGEFGQRPAAPQAEGVLEQSASPRGIRRKPPLRLQHELLKATRVDTIRFDLEQITRTGAADLHRAAAQGLADAGHIHLYRMPGARRRTLPPQLVNEPISRYRLAKVDQQKGEHGPLLQAAKRQLTAIGDDLQRP